ncbi:MAG: MoaD/ThiS family protein [Gemmataceae bacterium]|nr:MoaD/ThiS family protein [Gemmataceae bacterium]
MVQRVARWSSALRDGPARYNIGMSAAAEVVVEFYSMARQRAGVESIKLQARTLADAIRTVAQTFPGLADLSRGPGVQRSYLISVNAGPFLDDWHISLAEGDRVLILSADAGG